MKVQLNCMCNICITQWTLRVWSRAGSRQGQEGAWPPQINVVPPQTIIYNISNKRCWSTMPPQDLWLPPHTCLSRPGPGLEGTWGVFRAQQYEHSPLHSHLRVSSGFSSTATGVGSAPEPLSPWAPGPLWVCAVLRSDQDKVRLLALNVTLFINPFPPLLALPGTQCPHRLTHSLQWGLMEGTVEDCSGDAVNRQKRFPFNRVTSSCSLAEPGSVQNPEPQHIEVLGTTLSFGTLTM